MSEINKKNKAKQEVNHICCRKTFQAVSYEARDPNAGKESNFQKLWEMTHMKPNEHWVTNASAEDKVKDVIAEKIQEIEEGTNVDPIVNAAFVQIMGEKSKYILGQVSGIKSANRVSSNEIQQQFQAQQKEAEEERRKRKSVESKLMEVKNQLEKERKNREVMEVRLVHVQKLLKESVIALVSLLQKPKNDLPTSIMSIISLDGRSSASLMNKNLVFKKVYEELEARTMLSNAEETNRRLLSEKSSLEAKIIDLEKKISR